LHHSRDGCNVHCTRSPGEQARAGTIAAKHAVHGRNQANNLLERWQAARDKLPDGRRRLLDGILEPG